MLRGALHRIERVVQEDEAKCRVCLRCVLPLDRAAEQEGELATRTQVLFLGCGFAAEPRARDGIGGEHDPVRIQVVHTFDRRRSFDPHAELGIDPRELLGELGP